MPLRARPGGRSKVWSRREQAGEERVQRRKQEGRSARLFQGGGGAIIDAPSRIRGNSAACWTRGRSKPVCCCLLQDCVFSARRRVEVKVWAAAVLHIAHYDHFSPTYRVPTDTSRAKSGGVSSDLLGRKLRHGRSRKDRSERGRHHAKGTRYVGEKWP